MITEKTREGGSFTIELSLIILGLLLVLLLFFSLHRGALSSLYSPWAESEAYEEAFQKKIQDLRHEKVLREER